MQNMLEQGPDFWCWFDTTQFSYHCVHPIHAKMFSIQILIHFSQIVPRVCTLVLFIKIVTVCAPESNAGSVYGMDIKSYPPQRDRKVSAPCCLFSLGTWPFKQMVLPKQGNSQHQPSTASSRHCFFSTLL